MSGYDAAYAAWASDPEGYWRATARLIDWDSAPERIFDAAAGPYGRWFPDARLNTCHNAVDRHVAAGRGAQPAIIWDSPMTGRCETLTYAALLERVAKLAGALATRGVAPTRCADAKLPVVDWLAIARQSSRAVPPLQLLASKFPAAGRIFTPAPGCQ